MSVGILAAAHVAHDHDLRAIFGDRAPRRLDRTSELGLAAAGLAFQRAAAKDPRFAAPFDDALAGRAGVFFASGYGNVSGSIAFLEKIRDKGARFANPIEFPNLVLSAGAGNLSLQFRLRAELLTLTQERTAGHLALSFAFEAVAAGRLDLALVVGAEERSAARTRMNELLGKGEGDEGAAALVLTRDPSAPVRVLQVAMLGPPADDKAAVARCLRGSGYDSAEIVRLPGRGEQDIGGVLDATHAFTRLASGELSRALCAEHGPDGACAVLLAKGAA